MGKKYVQEKEGTLKVDLAHWVTVTLNSFEFLYWSELGKIDTPMKIKSLMWLYYHGAINTASRTSHWKQGNSNLCEWCVDVKETFLHMFFECKRTQDFWKHVAQFLAEKINIQYPTAQFKPISKYDIMNAFHSFKGFVPNHQVIFSYAIWELHRAKTEGSLSQIYLSGEQLFKRMKNSIMNKIIEDHHRSKINESNTSWFDRENNWFYIEPGGDFEETVVFI